MKRFTKVEERKASRTYIDVVFNKKLPDVLARELAMEALKDLSKIEPEFGQRWEALPDDAQMEFSWGAFERELPQEEFESRAAQELARWAADKMTANSMYKECVKDSSIGSTGPDGKSFRTEYAIGVVVA